MEAPGPMDDVARWLAGLGLKRYAKLFAANDLPMPLLRTLSDADLKALGVGSLGHRKRLLAALAALETEPAASPKSHPAERRHLTVMFVDLVGSTELSVKLDPEEMREVLRIYQNAVGTEVTRFGGYVAKLMGDGVLTYFGWPTAHEHEAERAVRAGMGVVATVSRLVTPASGVLAARVGIASGMVVVGEVIGEGGAREETVVGEAPSLAARLQALAPSGGILIADATRSLLAGLFELAPLGELSVKGFTDPISAWRIVGEVPHKARLEARLGLDLPPMVGRDQEHAHLLQWWRAAQRGEGRAVLVSGGAGIGKSRLLHELRVSIADTTHQEVRWECSPFHGETPLWPILQELVGSEPGPTLDLLEERLGPTGDAATPAIVAVAALLGIVSDGRHQSRELSPAAQRAQLLTMLVDRLQGLAARRPLLVTLEDVHWVDATTLEFLRLLLARVDTAAMLVVITCRPEALPAMPTPPSLIHLTLGGLDRTAVEAMVRRLAPARKLPAALIEAILLRTDGVPLFVEELTKALASAAGTIGQPQPRRCRHHFTTR